MSVNLIQFFVILFNSLCAYNDIDEVNLETRGLSWLQHCD